MEPYFEKGLLDPRNPAHQDADNLISEAAYNSIMSKADSSKKMPSSLIAFVKVAQPSDFSELDAAQSVPFVARFLSDYTEEERNWALFALKAKFGVSAACITFEYAISKIFNSDEIRAKFSKDGIDGSVLIACATVNQSLKLLRPDALIHKRFG